MLSTTGAGRVRVGDERTGEAGRVEDKEKEEEDDMVEGTG